MFGNVRYFVSLFGIAGYRVAVRQLQVGRNRAVTVRVRPRGLASPCFIRLNTTDVQTYEQVFRAAQYDLPCVLKPKVIIDAGANIGLSSLWFLKRYPRAQIFSIEPESGNYQMLIQNLKNAPNAVPIHGALWSEDGLLTLLDPGNGDWAFQTTDAEICKGTTKESVKALTIPNLMNRFSLQSVDLLKLDIEGAELDLFTRNTEWLERVNTILVELHDRIRPGCREVFDSATRDFPYRLARGEIVGVSRHPFCNA